MPKKRTDTRDAMWQDRLDKEARFDPALHGRRARAPYETSASAMAAVLRTLLRMVGLYKRGVRNAYSPVIHEIPLAFNNLPKAFHGYRILQLSDLHFSEDQRFVETIVDLVSGVEADLCVLTGDYRFKHHGAYEHVFAAMQTVLSHVKAPDGTLAILGNHDLSAFVEPFRAMGVTWLINEHLPIQRGDASLWVAGIDDPHRYRCHDIAGAIDGIPTGAFKILLAHSPEIFQDAARNDIDLCLCGHTHGGQIVLPLLGPPFLNIHCERRYGKGLWQHGGTTGYTSNGLGATDLPVRFNCPPEAPLIRLLRT